MAEEKKFIPLMISEGVAGMVHIDLETGTIEGKLKPEMAEILLLGLENNLYSISFFGKAGARAPEAQERLREFAKGESNDPRTDGSRGNHRRRD